jgi:hypothetical protein
LKLRYRNVTVVLVFAFPFSLGGYDWHGWCGEFKVVVVPGGHGGRGRKAKRKRAVANEESKIGAGKNHLCT